jgi:hypothetical protein
LSLKRFYIAYYIKSVLVENAVIRFRLPFIISKVCFLTFIVVYIAPALIALITVLAQ